MPGIPTDEGTQISLQRAFNLAYSQRILDLDGNPIPQSHIYVTRDVMIVEERVINPETRESLGNAVELAMAGRLMAPFEDKPWRLWSKKRCRKILDLITGKRLSLS